MTVTVKTVSVHYERKHNLGDYSSANIGCQLWADVSDDQDLDVAMAALWDMAKANVKAQLLPLTSKTKAQVEQVFMGLPLELQEIVCAKGAPVYDDDGDDLDTDDRYDDLDYGIDPKDGMPFGDK
jgi:hypothetical protein